MHTASLRRKLIHRSLTDPQLQRQWGMGKLIDTDPDPLLLTLLALFVLALP